MSQTPVPPFLSRQIKTQKMGAAGRKAEESLAKRLGGVQTIASGAIVHDKADIKVDKPSHNFIIEGKTTCNDSLSLKRDWLLKIYQEALEVGKVPALAFQFTNDVGVSEVRDRWVMLPENIWNELVEGDD